ncbi:hypothetical protein LUZ60_014040 [Juncus effusus]|nr:hypothetical protein LUZ60_014040 [Juncus effusus]
MGEEGRENQNSETEKRDGNAEKNYEKDEKSEMEEKYIEEVGPMPLMALNHISRLCESVQASIVFYVKVLGFVLIKRPPSLHFNGAWLFNYGVGVHLVQKQDDTQLPDADRNRLDPMDNHISFQCEDMDAMEKRLKEMKIKYLKRTINEEEGSPIDQLFFKDPDGFMIEICNCENLELVPAGAAGRIKLPRDCHNPPLQL